MEKLYYNEPKLKEWKTRIINKFEKDGEQFIELEKSAFYPEGGGQPSDLGTVDGIKILDAVEEGENVYYKIESIPENEEVYCTLDYKRRLDHSQHHSGQHLLSAVFEELYEAKTVGFHLGEDSVTVDIDKTDISEQQFNQVEKKINDYIYENKKFKTYVVGGEKLQELPLRKMPKVTEDIRIVEIEDGVDCSACCGTHVSSTGEIGILKIVKTEKVKDKTRVYFKCGMRALKDYDDMYKLMGNITKAIGAGRNEIVTKIKKMNDEIKQVQKSLNVSNEELSKYEARELINRDGSQKVIEKYYKDKDFKSIQTLAKEILSLGDYIVIVSSEKDNKILFSHNGTNEVKCGQIFKENIKEYNGRGGGNHKQAQAGFESNEDLKRFHQFLVSQMK